MTFGGVWRGDVRGHGTPASVIVNPRGKAKSEQEGACHQMNAEAFYSDVHHCWFVPVASELITLEELGRGIGPVKVQLLDKQLVISRLPEPAGAREGAAT